LNIVYAEERSRSERKATTSGKKVVLQLATRELLAHRAEYNPMWQYFYTLFKVKAYSEKFSESPILS